MATISDARAVFGISALATPIGTNLSGSMTVGIPQTQVRLDSANVAYSTRAIIASGDFVVVTTTGVTSGSTTFVAGAAQVETATAVGTITLSGDAEVVVTAAGMTGSPKTIAVAVLDTDTAATWAGKVRTALAADTEVTAMFSVGGATDKVILTRLPTNTFTVPGGTLNLYAANDATLNISLDNDTCTGITTAATSANTTAGVVSSGVKVYDGDAKDIEGETLPTISVLRAVLAQCAAGGSSYTNGVDETGRVFGTQANSYASTRLFVSSDPNTTVDLGTLTFNDDTAPADITVTVIGATA